MLLQSSDAKAHWPGLHVQYRTESVSTATLVTLSCRLVAVAQFMRKHAAWQKHTGHGTVPLYSATVQCHSQAATCKCAHLLLP
jgi:hypothetical protein